MKIKSRAGLAAFAAAAVVACGGETLAVIGAIGAAGGDFPLDANGATPQLEDSPNPAGGTYSLNINPVPFNDEYLFAESYDVRAGDSSALPGVVCNGVTGTMAGNRLDLGPCFRGRYTNANRLVSDDGKTVLLYRDFEPKLDRGIWVDIRKPSRRFKFKDDKNGCELKDGVLTGATVSLDQVDQDGIYNSVTNFTVGAEVWATGAYVGASGLRLTGAPGKLELERRRDEPATACP
jgi:hypothetical protein